MNDSNRKVVLLKGDNNKWYEQAIFIMRQGQNADEIDFVKEAEKIINSQMLYSQIADKYEEQKILMPATTAIVPAGTAAAPKVQVVNKKPQAQPSKLDFTLNLTLLIVAIAIAAAFLYVVI